MRLRALGEVDVGLRGGDAGALHALGAERPAADAEAGDLAGDRVDVGAGVDEGAEQHVAADAGEAVQVGDARHFVDRVSRRRRVERREDAR